MAHPKFCKCGEKLISLLSPQDPETGKQITLRFCRILDVKFTGPRSFVVAELISGHTMPLEINENLK